jgi:hypothetical protein
VKARYLPIAALALSLGFPVLAQEQADRAKKLQEQVLEEKARAEIEKARAEADRAKAEAEKAKAEAEHAKIKLQKARASLSKPPARQPAVVEVNKEKSQSDPGAHVHDGLFIRLTAGPGLAVFSGTGHLVTADGQSYKIHINESTQAGGSFSMGSAIGENLILHGDLWLSVVSTEQGSYQPYKEFGTVVIGVGLTYYWMPHNFYLTGSLGMASSFLVMRDHLADLSDEDRTSEAIHGAGLSVTAGKEWWVSDNWAVGVAMQVEFTYAEGEDNDLILRHGGAKVLFCATYQ